MCKIQAISPKEFFFQFSNNRKENESKIIEFIEKLSPYIEIVFLNDKRRLSDILYVCSELLNNTCEHIESEMKTASIVIFFAEDSISMQYTDSGDFFTRQNVKEALESRISIKSTRKNGRGGGVGTEIITTFATALNIDITSGALTLFFE